MTESVPPFTILLVEDTVDQARLIARWLCLAGFRVEVALDGAAGLALSRRDGFDMVIAGIELPFSKGIAIAEWSKKERPERPVILLTAANTLKEKDEQRAHVADLLLRKPLRRDVLCGAVQALLEDRRGEGSESDTWVCPNPSANVRKPDPSSVQITIAPPLDLELIASSARTQRPHS
jgi:two-component system, OmpR family, copper resistance phosphate regulon response regulator CusR